MADPAAAAPMPADDDSASAAAPGSAGGDLSQGYCVEISVLPDGSYKVSGPEPLQEEAEEEQGEAGSEMGQDFNDLTSALKGVLTIIKSNPVSGDADAQFQAGYSGK